MKFYLFKPLFFILLIIACFSAKAQQVSAGAGAITGKLVDAENNQPVSFATVAIIRKADNQIVTNLQSDMDGNFNVANLADGIYMLRATYVGYLTLTRDSLTIRPNKRTIALGLVKMRASKGVLKEVTVTAQRSKIQLGIDKKSFNVSESLVSQGGSATDLLANVPSVQVDVDGNLSLRGSSNVRVLINGKPSTLTGGNLSDILQSIPASSIETIEVITNPSSKYDAEGQSGIINIVLKRNAQLGFTGSASVSAGTQNTRNATVSLAYQTKKFNIYGNYSYRKSTRIGDGFTNKTTDTVGIHQQSNQINNQQFTFGGHNIRSGIEYYLDPKNTLTFSDNINIRDIDRFQNGSTNITRNGALFQLQNTNNVSNGNGTNLDFNLDFEHKFAKKQEVLTANIGYSSDRSNNHDDLNTSTTNYTTPNTPPSITEDYKLGHERNINIQADYTLPLKDGRFETGFRSTISRSDNNYLADTLNWTSNVFSYSADLSNDFVYKQNINALYGNYQHQFGNFGVQGGVRLEDAHINTELNATGVFTPHTQDYFRIYPTLFLTEKLSDAQTIQLSYSRRVTRPQDRQLSPFLDVSNKQNYQQGNPNLLPEDTHSMELSYIDYWKSLTLTSSLYYRLTNDDIQQIFTNNLNRGLTTFANIKSASNAGYELIAKVSPSSLIDLTANLNAYYRHIAADPSYNILSSSGYSYNTNLTASIKPTKQLGFQLRGDYQGANVTAQGRMHAMYGMDGGIKYDATKALSFSVNSRDIFNSRKFISDTHIDGLTVTNQESQRRFSTRSVMFTVAYHIGKTPQQMGNKRGKDNKDKDKKSTDSDNQDDDSLGGSQGNNNGGGGGGSVQGSQGGPKMQ
jgi:outer membrane receptor protein involved in Fe transport